VGHHSQAPLETLRAPGGRSGGSTKTTWYTRQQHTTTKTTTGTGPCRLLATKRLHPGTSRPPRWARHRHQHGGNDRRQRMARIFGAPAAQDELFFGARSHKLRGARHWAPPFILIFRRRECRATRSNHQRPLIRLNHQRPLPSLCSRLVPPSPTPAPAASAPRTLSRLQRRHHPRPRGTSAPSTSAPRGPASPSCASSSHSPTSSPQVSEPCRASTTDVELRQKRLLPEVGQPNQAPVGGDVPHVHQPV